MKTQYLSEFMSLATALSYAHVAREHHVSTSVLSKHIKSLENELGVTLFNRSTTRVSLTPEGRRFFEGIAPIVEQFDNFLDQFKNSPAPTSAQLRIVLGKDFSPLLQATTQVAFELKEKGVYLEYSMPKHKNYYDVLNHPDVDALITFATESVPAKCEIFPLYDDPFAAVVPNEHPLAKKKQLSIVDDLSMHRVISLKGEFFRTGEETVNEVFCSHGVKPLTTVTLTPNGDTLNLMYDFKDVLIVPRSALSRLMFLSERTHTILSFAEKPVYKLSFIYLPHKYSEALMLYASELKAALHEASEDS